MSREEYYTPEELAASRLKRIEFAHKTAKEAESMSPEERKAAFAQPCEEHEDNKVIDDYLRETRQERASSPIDHPSHYNIGTIETIDYLESLGIAEDFCVGNTIKYLSRYKHKEKPLEDLKKALWYLGRVISKREEDESA